MHTNRQKTADLYVRQFDEISKKFYPLLTYGFVRQYLEQAETRNIQLIVTTHEYKLMDFGLLRMDEIVFFNKDDISRFTIFSLDRFNKRFDKRFAPHNTMLIFTPAS